MIVLRPCPFCGGPPVTFVEDHDYPWGFVFCHECGAQGPTIDPTFDPGNNTPAAVRVSAAKAWNVSNNRHGDLYGVQRATLDESTGQRHGTGEA